MLTERKIYSKRLAGYLVDKGYRLLSTEDDVLFPGKFIWLFRDTPELQKTIDESMIKFREWKSTQSK